MIAYGILWPSIQRDSELLRRRIEEALSDALLRTGGYRAEAGGVSGTTGLRMTEMEANFRARALEQEITVTCSLCSDFRLTGRASEVLELQRDHRRDAHGRKPLSRRSSRHLSSFKAAHLTDEDQEAIQADIARRKRLHGIEAA